MNPRDQVSKIKLEKNRRKNSEINKRHEAYHAQRCPYSRRVDFSAGTISGTRDWTEGVLEMRALDRKTASRSSFSQRREGFPPLH